MGPKIFFVTLLSFEKKACLFPHLRPVDIMLHFQYISLYISLVFLPFVRPEGTGSPRSLCMTFIHKG